LSGLAYALRIFFGGGEVPGGNGYRKSCDAEQLCGRLRVLLKSEILIRQTNVTGDGTMTAAEILLTLVVVNAIGVLAYLRWQRDHSNNHHNGEVR